MIGKYLKQQREFANISQHDLAKATGLKQANISRWENDIQEPQVEAIIQLAQFYGISIDELVGISDNTQKGYEANNSLLAKTQPKSLAFINEFENLFTDKYYIEISKLCNAITPELRALALGYMIGLLQKNGINTDKILGY